MSLTDDKYRLFVMMKNVIPIYESKKFNKWFHENFNTEQHHLLASFSHRKTTNLLSCPVDDEEHQKAQANKINFAFENLPRTIAILIKYVQHIEETK